MALKTAQTTLATIQHRRGAEEKFDPYQMAAGEWAVSTDTKKVWMCFQPGLARRMATYEAFEEDMLEIQTILATCQDIQTAVEAFEKLAEQHKNQAESYSKESRSWAIGGTGVRQGEDTDNSKYWSQQSASSASSAATYANTATSKANAASTSEANAASSATSAATSAETATQKANVAEESATSASASAISAAASASTATTKASEASTSASDADASSTSADTYAKKAQSYAVGGTGTRPGEDIDNSKYYYEQSKNISQGLSGTLIPMGTVSFANLPALSNVESGWMYNVSDQFSTTFDFMEGAGNIIPAGANVYKTAEGKWDILAGTPVTTVNGQTGNVNITPENIGALPEDGNAVSATRAEQDAYGNNIAINYLMKRGDASLTFVHPPSFAEDYEFETEYDSNGKVIPNYNYSGTIPLCDVLLATRSAFSDLSKVATTGKYSDLSDRLTLTNNDLATVPGTAWDAVRGAQIRKDILYSTRNNFINITPASKDQIFEFVSEYWNNTSSNYLPISISGNGVASIFGEAGIFLGIFVYYMGNYTGAFTNLWTNKTFSVTVGYNGVVTITKLATQNEITQLNSDLAKYEYATDPNLVQANFAVLNGWSEKLANAPTGFKNTFGILITAWVFKTSDRLGSTRCQALIYSNGVAFRRYSMDTLWGDWTTF